MTTTTYEVTGMTCGHCVSAVIETVGALDGVADVVVDLDAGARSTVTVTSDAVLSPDEVQGALGEAGDYHLVPRTDR